MSLARMEGGSGPRSPHKEWDRDMWPSGRTSHLYSAQVHRLPSLDNEGEVPSADPGDTA